MDYPRNLYLAVKEEIHSFFDKMELLKKKDPILFAAFLLVMIPLLIFLFIMVLFFIGVFFDYAFIQPYVGTLFSILIILFLPIFIGLTYLQRRRKKPKNNLQFSPHSAGSKDTYQFFYSETDEGYWTKFKFNSDDITLIKNSLNQKNVKTQCPMCESNALTIDNYFGFSQNYIVLNKKYIYINSGIPTIKIICNKCGYIMEYALKPLGLEKIKFDDNSEFKEDNLNA